MSAPVSNSDVSSPPTHLTSPSPATDTSKRKRKPLSHIPSSLPADIRDAWQELDDVSLLFDERLTSLAFLLTATASFQYVPVGWGGVSAGPMPQQLLSTVRERDSREEEEDRDEADSSKPKIDATEQPAATSYASSSSLSIAGKGGSIGGSSVSGLSEAQQLLVDSSPDPPQLPDAAPMSASISASSSASSDAVTTTTSLQLSASASSSPSATSSAHLASIAAALSSAPLVDLPRSLPSLAYLDLHQRREHVLRHLLLVTAATQKRTIEHSGRDKKDDNTSSKRKKSTAKPATSASLTSANPTSTSASSGSSVSPMLRLTILSLFPIIQSLSRQDPTLLSSLLSTLLSLLHSLPLLSLRSEAADCIASFRSLLQSMVGEGSGGTQHQQVNVGDALTALIGLALAEGKIRHILAAIATMLQLHGQPAQQQQPPQLSIAPFLQQLADYRADRHLPTLEPASFLFSFHHHSPSLSINRFATDYQSSSSPPPQPATSVSAPSLGVDIPFLGSIASDGVWLYVLNEYGLFSVGSGKGGSVRQQLYGANRQFHQQIAERALRVVETEMKETDDKKQPPSQSPSQSSRHSGGELKDPEAEVSPRSGTLLYVNQRLFFASPNYEFLEQLIKAASASVAAGSGSGGSSQSPLLSLPSSSALIVEVDVNTLELKSNVAIEHARSALPLYMSITTDGTHIYALYREQHKKSKHSSSASSSSALSVSSSSASSASSSSSSSTALSSTLFATPNCVDVYTLHNDRFTFGRSFSLDDATTSTVSSSASAAYDRNIYSSSSLSPATAATPFSCYATGGPHGHLVRLSVPSRSSGSYGHISRQEVYAVDSGRLVTRVNVGVTAEGEAKGSASCYDAVNDCIWQYQHTSLLVQAWKNIECHETPTTDASLPPPFVVVAEADESEQDSSKAADNASSVTQLLPASAALAYQLRRQCMLAAPNSGVLSSPDVLSYVSYGESAASSKGKGSGEIYLAAQSLPLTVDLHNDTFKHLHTILVNTSATLSAPADSTASSPSAVSALYSLLTSALSILQTNLEHLPSPFDDDMVTMSVSGQSAAAHTSSSSASSASSSSVVGSKASKHRIAPLALFNFDHDIIEQLSSLLLSLLTTFFSRLPVTHTDNVRRLALSCLMTGLSHFFPASSQLLSLLRPPYLSFPAILEALADYPGLCTIINTTAAIEEQLASGGVIRVLCERVESDNVNTLNSDVIVSRSPVLSPALRVLVSLQRSLLSRVDDASVRPLVVQYAVMVLAMCVRLLRLVEVAFERLPTSSTDSTSASATAATIDHKLRSSAVGVLLPPLLSILSRRDILCRLDTATCSSLLLTSSPSSLSTLLHRIDRYLSLSSLHSASIDSTFLNQSIPPAKRLTHTVETSHPYDGSRRIHSSLAFSQCQYLILYFDPRSHIHKSDTLLLSAITGEMRVPAITGTAFPKLPLILAGDSLTVSFQSDGSGGKRGGDKLYGFKLVIHGVRLSPLLSLHWAADVLNSLCLLSARVVHAMTFTTVPQPPVDEARQLLNAELFKGGMTAAPASGETAVGTTGGHRYETFLHALINNDSPARELMDLLCKKFTGRPPLSGTARKAIATVERAMAAVLLHHSELAGVAASVAGDLTETGSTTSSAVHVDLAVAHPDFALLQPLWKQLYALDAAYLSAARVEKRWLDLLAVGVTEASKDIKNMQPIELQQLCASRGLVVDKTDAAVNQQRLTKKLTTECGKLAATGATAAGGDLWATAYANVSQRFIERCMLLLSLRSTATSYPPINKQPAGVAMTELQLLQSEDEPRSSASSQTHSPTLSPRTLSSRSYTDQLKRNSSSISSSEPHSLPLSRVNSTSSRNAARTVLGRPTLTDSPHRGQRNSAIDRQASFALWKQREQRAHSASTLSLAALTQQRRMTTQDKRVKAIIAFLSSPSAALDVSTVVRSLEDRRKLAMARIDGIKSFNALIHCTHLDSARNSLLLGFGDGIRRYWGGGGGEEGRQVHYLYGLNGVGPEVAAGVRAAWFELLDTFVSLLSTNTHPSTKLLTLDCVGLFYRVEDVAWLADSQLFSALRSLLSSSSSTAIATSSRTLFSHLASICLWWSPSQLPQHTSTVHTASALTSPRASLSTSLQSSAATLQLLQHDLFTVIFQELRKEMDTLATMQQPAASTANGTPNDSPSTEAKEKEEKTDGTSDGAQLSSSTASSADEDADLSVDTDSSTLPTSVDSACYELLTLIFRLRHSPAARHQLSKSLDALSTLMSVFQPSTLRVQRLSLRLIRYMLTDADIGGRLMLTLGSASASLLQLPGTRLAVGEPREAAVVSAMLDRIGELLTTGGSTSTFVASATDGKDAAATTGAGAAVVPRRLSVSHHHSPQPSTSSSDLYNLSILNTDPDTTSGASFANTVLTGLKDVLKASMKSLKSDLRTALTTASASASSVTIMTGTKDEMNRIARIAAKRGFGCQIAAAPVQDGYLRNEKMAEYNPSAVQCGQSTLQLVSELVTVLRVLAQSAGWGQHVDSQLQQRLKQLERCARQFHGGSSNSASSLSASSAAALASAPLSALAVLGGFKEVLRVGGRVQVSSGDDSEATRYGVLVAYERGEVHATAVIEGEDQPVTVDVSSLTAVPPAFTAASLLSKPAVVDDMLQFLQQSNDRMTAKGQDEKSEAVTASERSATEAEQYRLTYELSLYSLRALCAALADNPSLASTFSSHLSLMPYLIATAKQSQPSALLTELEEQNLKCLERFLSLQQPPLYPTTQLAQQQSDQELSALLPHFPFASQAKRLPTAFTSEHARFIIFEDGVRRTLQYTKDQHGGSEFSLSRSAGGSSSAMRRLEEQLRADSSDEFLLLGNAGVPVSLPQYYFEVELLTTNPISVGLCPQPKTVTTGNELGMDQLEQLSSQHPSYQRLHALLKARLNNSWCEHSVRYSSRDGHCIRRIGGKEHSQAYSDTYGKGDVIGVGWNLRDGTVYFTRNGQLKGQATSIQPAANAGSAVKYYPAVGFLAAGTRVRINFGQEPFRYRLDTASESDESEAEKADRLKRTALAEAAQKEAEEQAKVRAEVEKVARQAAREEAAQSLLDMCFGLLPSQRHALKALELHRDNAQAAANFIFENEVAAIQEINRLIREEDESKKKEEEKADAKAKADKQKEAEMERKGEADKQKVKSSSSTPTKATTATADTHIYDRNHTASLILPVAYSRPVVDDGSDVDPVEEQWLAETEALLRAARLFPSESMLQGIMGQLRQGGDARANCILSLPISLPQPQQPRRDEEQKAVVDVLLPEEARPGIRVKIATPSLNSRVPLPASISAAMSSASSAYTASPPASAPTLTSSSSSAAAVWYLPAMASIAGAIGVITLVDLESELCRVQFVSSETSSVSEWWLPIAHLQHVQRDSDAWVGLEKLSDVRGQNAIDNSNGLLQLYARKAVLSIMEYESEANAAIGNTAAQAVVPVSTAPVNLTDILQLISAEMLPALALNDLPSLPPPMQSIVHRALVHEPTLPSAILSEARTVLMANTFSASSSENDDVKEWEDDSKALATTQSRAIALAFHSSSRLPKPSDTLTCYTNKELTKLVKQWKGGEKTKATPLLPALLNSPAVWLQLRKEKASSRSTTVRVEGSGVPDKLSLGLYVVDYIAAKCAEAADGRVRTSVGSVVEVRSEGVDWVQALLTSLTALASFLATPALSPLIKQSAFHTIRRALCTLQRLSSAVPALDLHVGLLYEEMLDLYDGSKKDGKIVLISPYLQSLIELLSTYRRVCGEGAFTSRHIGSDGWSLHSASAWTVAEEERWSGIVERQ